MIRTVEAVVDPSGNVRLLEDVQLPGPRRALVTILDDAPRSDEPAPLSETALADWSRPEEDTAWSHLQLRPAVALADAGRGDWILCQVTSNPYGDPRAVHRTPASFGLGSLRADSYAWPG